MRGGLPRYVQQSTRCGLSLHLIQWQQFGHYRPLLLMLYGKENHMLINKLSCRRAFAGRYTVNHLIPC